MKQKIEREQFEAWLFSQPLDRGFSYGQPDECAVAMFIRETRAVVYREEYCWSSHAIRKLAGDWLHDLVFRTRPLTIRNMQTRYRKMFPETIHENEPETAGLLPDLPVGMAGRAESDRVPAVAG